MWSYFEIAVYWDNTVFGNENRIIIILLSLLHVLAVLSFKHWLMTSLLNAYSYVLIIKLMY